MVNVNLCCGTVILTGVVNLDIVPPYDMWADVVQHIPFNDGQVVHATCYHALEHFQYPDEVSSFLREVVRVIDNYGQFTVTTPDTVAVVQMMSRAHLSRADTLRNLVFGTRDSAYAFHKWAYTERSLRILLSKFFDEVVVTKNQDDHGGPGLQAVCRGPRKGRQ